MSDYFFRECDYDDLFKFYFEGKYSNLKLEELTYECAIRDIKYFTFDKKAILKLLKDDLISKIKVFQTYNHSFLEDMSLECGIKRLPMTNKHGYI